MKINHRVQIIIDIAEFAPKELFFVIQPLSQCQDITVSIIRNFLATTNARPAIL